ncbi:MAG: 50S ribosomal protein L30 [Miniphocaeibacter sp.]|uniref:50S ribosomal protein L30 n=1 Tax=Miniphocaeibacter sp. TaxID=3100973 RepID=UPI0017BC5442|nr:50S ribosomal protein L30 [Gallicola sp.]
MSKLKVTLKKSRIGRIEKHIKNVDALGLKKIGDVVEIEDTPANRGKINQVAFMLDIEEVK